MLEAEREALYEEMPVAPGWHEAYARGEADTRGYRRYVDRCTGVHSGYAEGVHQG